MTDEDGENVAIAAPSPDGKGDVHTLKIAIGTVADADLVPTTNRAYFDIRSQLELTAEECRELADQLEFVANQLDEHHDVRMPLEEM